MADPGPLAPLLACLQGLMDWWKISRVQGVIIGGVAASILGRPRVTRDVDAVIFLDQDNWSHFLAEGAPLGFGPRLDDALDFARQARVLLVQHQPSEIDVDLSLGALPFEEEVLARSQIVEIGSLSLPLPTPEDLVILKAIAHRPRDLIDIEGVLDAHSRLDRRRIRRWVQEFANALDMPELVDDLEKLLRPQRKRKKGKGKKKKRE